MLMEVLLWNDFVFVFAGCSRDFTKFRSVLLLITQLGMSIPMDNRNLDKLAIFIFHRFFSSSGSQIKTRFLLASLCQ